VQKTQHWCERCPGKEQPVTIFSSEGEKVKG